MITFNNIVKKFQEFCTDHFFIKTFSYGSPSDVDLEKFEQYPLLHLVYTGGDYNSPKAKTYNLEVYILSLPPSEADKVTYQKENISDAEQVAEDILADIQNGGNIFQFGFHYDLINASVTPLEEEKSNALAGCLLDLAISVPYTYDSCNAPLTGVEPEGSDTPSFKARGLLRVREDDGSPDVLSVATINVPNGSLTDDGEGEITLSFDSLPSGVEGQTLVYQSGAWVSGFPTSSGQVSNWVATSTKTFNVTGTGLTPMTFGSVLAGDLTFDQDCRAGWNMGMNINGSVMLAAPVGITSNIDITITVRVNAPVGSLAQLQLTSAVGWFTAPTLNQPTIVGNGTETEYQITTTVTGESRFWQLANSATISMNVLVNPGTIVVKPQTIEIDINHA